VFESRILRRIFVPDREVTGGCRRLHNEELHNFYSSSNDIRMIKSRRMRWAGQVARAGEMKNAYKILVGTPEEKRLFVRPEIIILKWVFKLLGCECVEWIHLSQDEAQWLAFVNTVMNFRFPLKVRNFLSTWTTISFLMTLLHGVIALGGSKTTVREHLSLEIAHPSERNRY
jgi:hypothetical protein